MKVYKVYINGKLLPADKAQISVYDAAYLYGEGLFETLVALNGQILFIKEHLRRLFSGVKALQIPLRCSQRRLAQEIVRTVRANRLKDAYIRINISAHEGEVGRRRRSPKGAHVVIFVQPFDPYPEALYRKGCRLIFVRGVRNDPMGVANIKTTNYLAKMLARKEIAARKATDGVLFNAEGHLTECASSNLFIVKRRCLLTPPVLDGVLPGVTRKQVIQLARRHKITVQEKTLTPRHLERADEIFITSTLKGIMPVAQLERRRVGSKVPGPLTKHLREVFDSLVRSDVGA